MIKLFMFIACLGLVSSAGAATLQKTTLVGVGATLEKVPGGELQVNALIPGAPAERAGLQVGDLVVAIRPADGGAFVDVHGVNLPDAVAMIRGPLGEAVTLRLRRGASVSDLRIVREAFDVDDLVWRMREIGRLRKA